eukprot:815476_1
MADTEKQLVSHQNQNDQATTAHTAQEEEAPTVVTEKPKSQPEKKETATEEEEEEFPPPQMSENTMKQKSVRMQKQLRVVVEDLFRESSNPDRDQQPKADRTGTTLGIRADSSMVNRQVSSILIDMTHDDTVEFETTTIALPKSPICALLLMESIGTFQQLDKVNQFSIMASILFTIVAQIIAGSVLFTKQLYGENVPSDYEWSDCFINLVVIAFIVIYLSQDCAQIYKMVVLLRWMRDAKKLARHSAFMIGLYLLTNLLLYIFLLYYSIVELLINERVVEKLQAAVAVYFILEVDDWLYNVTVEPLKILEDEIFSLNIRGTVGSRNKRLRHVTFWFWGILTCVLILQFALFITRAQHQLTIND